LNNVSLDITTAMMTTKTRNKEEFFIIAGWVIQMCHFEKSEVKKR